MKTLTEKMLKTAESVVNFNFKLSLDDFYSVTIRPHENGMEIDLQIKVYKLSSLSRFTEDQKCGWFQIMYVMPVFHSRKNTLITITITAT